MENRKMTGMGNFNFRPGLVLVLILLLGANKITKNTDIRHNLSLKSTGRNSQDEHGLVL